MSSKPHLGGAEKVVEIVDRLRSLEREIEDLTPKAERLQLARELHLTNRKALAELLVSMDCESQGNFGWPGRAAALVAMVIDEARRGR